MTIYHINPFLDTSRLVMSFLLMFLMNSSADEVEVTNFNWPKDKVLDWILAEYFSVQCNRIPTAVLKYDSLG